MTKLFILLTAFALFSCGGDSNSGSITAPESLATENASSPESTPSAADPTAFTLMSFRDLETGTIWNLRGEATSGELAGAQLEQLPAYNAYWFAWASFWPATAVWGESGSGRLAADTFKAAAAVIPYPATCGSHRRRPLIRVFIPRIWCSVCSVPIPPKPTPSRA